MPLEKQSNIFFLSWILPPAQGGSAYIVHQLAKHFDPDILTIAGGSKDFFKTSDWYDGVKYHYFFTELNWRGHGDRYFKPFRFLLFPFLLINLFLLIKKQKHEKIVVTFPDAYYLIAGYIISMCLNLKLFIYFHNTYADNRSGFSLRVAKKIQEKIFKKSIRIFVMSDGMKSFYTKHYPAYSSKFEVLPHTFKEYPEVNLKSFKKTLTQPYKLVMIGTFNASNMEATNRVMMLISKHRNLFDLDVYSSSNKQLLKYKWGLDLDAFGVNYRGAVRQEDVLQIVLNYDASIVTHGFSGGYSEIEYQTIFPTRMIPLLISGIPILVHSPPNTYLNEFIIKYDCAELVSEKSEKQLYDALLRICQNETRRTDLLSNAKTASNYFYGPSVVSKFVAQLNSR